MRANNYGLTTNVLLNKALKIRKPVPIDEVDVVAANQTRIPVKVIQTGVQKFYIEAGVIPNLPSITLGLRKRNAKFGKNK